MATGTYAPQPIWTGFDDNGDPLAGGLLYTYEAGTTTPLATYSDVGLATANANPVVLDAAGRCTLFLSASSYKFVLKTSAGVTVATRDNVGSVPSANVDTDVPGTAGEALTATKVAYLLASTWFLADADAAASSTLPPIGFVVADIANGAAGTFRTAGRMTGFSGLTPGSDYYLSATAGEITATAPVNARYVGRADSISSLIIAANPPANSTAIGVVVDPKIKSLCNGRLTLTTGVPVTTADVTAATTLYWALYQGNQIGLYNGTRWQQFTVAQLSIAVPATTATMYDVFVDYNSGTPALSLTAWTNDTTRATALTTQDGVLVLTGSTGKRYVGSFRTTGVSGQTEDSLTKRYVWNYYHRVDRPLRRLETTATWTYTIATWRQANGSTSNQVEVVVGVAEDAIHMNVGVWTQNNVGANVAGVGIGEDSTTASASGYSGGWTRTQLDELVGCLIKIPGAGYHYYAWLEYATAANTNTWYGAAMVADGGAYGLSGVVRG